MSLSSISSSAPLNQNAIIAACSSDASTIATVGHSTQDQGSPTAMIASPSAASCTVSTSVSSPVSFASSLSPSLLSAALASSSTLNVATTSTSAADTTATKEVKSNTTSTPVAPLTLSLNFEMFRQQISLWENENAKKGAMGSLNDIAHYVERANQFLSRVPVMDRKSDQESYQKLYYPGVLACIELIERQPLNALQELNLSSPDDTLQKVLVRQLKAPLEHVKKSIQQPLLVTYDQFTLEQQRARTLALYSQQGFIEFDEKLKVRCLAHFDAIAKLIKRENPNALGTRCFISYAWPTQNNLPHEKWLQPFLKILHAHLKTAGLHPILDIVENRAGKNIYQFMEQIEGAEFVILACTESLFDKHHDERILAVQTELNHIQNKHNLDLFRGQVRVLPYLLSGTHSSSYPEHYHMYSTVRDWRDNSYLENLKQLIGLIYYPQGSSQDYNQLWEEFYKRDKENEALRKVMPSEAVQAFQEQKLHEKEYEQLCQQDFYGRLLRQQGGHQLQADQKISSSQPCSTERVSSWSSSSSLSTFSTRESMVVPTSAPSRVEIKSEVNTTDACTSISTSSIQVRSASTYTDQKEVKTAPLLIQALRDLYLETSTKAISLFVENKCLSLHDCFINLAIVYEEGQQEREKMALQRKGKEEKKDQRSVEASSTSIQDAREAFVSSRETSYQPKESIALDDLFLCRQQETKEPKRILVEGRAGIGKTILSRYLTYQWALENESVIRSMQGFHLVLLVPLRQLLQMDDSKRTSQQSLKTEMIRFLYEAVLNDATKASYHFELFQKELEDLEGQRTFKILYLLDGYDEIADIRSENSLRKEILNVLLAKPHCLVTSRPYYMDAEMTFDKRLENIGFTEEDIRLYTQKFFSLAAGMEAIVLIPSFQHLLETNSSIQGIAYIPLVLELLCSLWKGKGAEYSPLSEQPNLTDIYTAIVNYMQKRFLIKTEANGITEKSSIEAVQRHPRCQRVNKALEEIAWHGMKQKQPILSPKMIQPSINQKNYLELKEQTDYDQFLEQLFIKTGFLKGTEAAPQRALREQSYYFVHWTFQDFFAARYLVSTLNGSRKNEQATEADCFNFIRKNKYDRWFQMMWRFTFGLLSLGKERDVGLDHFWTAIEAEPRDLIGLGHIGLIISCLNESKQEVLAGVQNKFLEDYGRFAQEVFDEDNRISFRVDDEGWVRIGDMGLLESMQENSFIAKRSGFSKFLTTKLKNEEFKWSDWDEQGGISATRALGQLGQADEEAMEALIALLSNHQLGRIRLHSVKALEKISHGNERVITTLIGALRDEDEEVREAVVSALGKVIQMDESQKTERVITALIEALKDPERRVRIAIVGTLMKVVQRNESQKTEKVIAALIGVLREEDEQIGKVAIETFIRMIVRRRENQRKEGIIKAVMEWLSDKGKEEEKSSIELIQSDKKKLDRKNREVLKVFIESLMEWSSDKGKEMKKKSVEVLIQSSRKNKELLTVFILALLELSKDKEADENCIESLIIKLGKKDEEVMKVFSAILFYLYNGTMISTYQLKKTYKRNKDNKDNKDKNKENEGKEMDRRINGLITQLHTGDHLVRVNAAETLGEIGYGNEQVVNELIKALGDKHPGVKSRIIDSLGKIGQGSIEVIKALIKISLEGNEVTVLSTSLRAIRALSITDTLVNQYFRECFSAFQQKSMWPIWLLKWLSIKGTAIQYDGEERQFVIYSASSIIKYQLTSSDPDLVIPLRKSCQEKTICPYSLPNFSIASSFKKVAASSSDSKETMQISRNPVSTMSLFSEHASISATTSGTGSGSSSVSVTGLTTGFTLSPPTTTGTISVTSLKKS